MVMAQTPLEHLVAAVIGIAALAASYHLFKVAIRILTSSNDKI